LVYLLHIPSNSICCAATQLQNDVHPSKQMTLEQVCAENPVMAGQLATYMIAQGQGPQSAPVYGQNGSGSGAVQAQAFQQAPKIEFNSTTVKQ
jgi:hypothetical protein